MYRRNDPRLRRTLNQLSQNFESANESAQANLFTFGQNYINPCLSSIGSCLRSCTTPCFPSRENRLRRNRGRSRGRAELSFDFYDDWEDDESDGLLGWGNDELDRLLAGSGGYSADSHSGRQRTMSYGTRRERTRRKSAVQPHDGGPDPTIIPNTSYFGFLGRLPWKIGGKGLRYKPSAADLQEHPGAARRAGLEEQPLTEESDEEGGEPRRGHKRDRSHTTGSGHTTDSLSSRGDIFPSEDELDDAVPLDDEFAMVLERRTTNLGSDENSSGRTRSGERPSGSRMSTRTVSSKSTKQSGSVSVTTSQGKGTDSTTAEVPTLSDLKLEEERIRKEEEEDVERKRDAARKLAAQRGLGADALSSPLAEVKSEPSLPTSPVPTTPGTEQSLASPLGTEAETVPFPAFDARSLPEEQNAGSLSPTQDVPLSPMSSQREPLGEEAQDSNFVPARMPNFTPNPD